MIKLRNTTDIHKQFSLLSFNAFLIRILYFIFCWCKIYVIIGFYLTVCVSLCFFSIYLFVILELRNSKIMLESKKHQYYIPSNPMFLIKK